MSPNHHLDPATLVSRAAGALSPEMRAIVDTHLDACVECRGALARAEDVGGWLLEQQKPLPATRHAALRADMLERLERAGAPGRAPPADAPPADPDRLPAPLHPYFGTSYHALKWRWAGPGMRYIRTTGPSGMTLLMLRIAPGTALPVHGHGGGEITQILQGAYDDVLGRFAAGDVADLDPEVEHQPVTAPGAPCVCVAALEAPLRYTGWFARALQPIFGI